MRNPLSDTEQTRLRLGISGAANIQHLCLFFYLFHCVPAERLLQTGYGLDAPQYSSSYILVYMGLNQHRIQIFEPEYINLVMLLPLSSSLFFCRNTQKLRFLSRYLLDKECLAQLKCSGFE